MEKLAIIYFSGTGNTKYLAEIMKETAISKGLQADLINIEKDEINPNQYEKIIIGGPVYVERYPEILLKYIKANLCSYIGTCMLFSTQSFEGLTPVFSHTVKRIKGLNARYFKYFPMPNNFYNFMFKKTPEDKELQLVKTAALDAQNAVEEFLEGKTNHFEISKSRVVLAEAAYKFTYPLLRKILMRQLDIDKDKCIKCGICEKFCPTKSITISPDLKITNDCTFCQRCINKCPQNAFTYKNNPVDQYNLESIKKNLSGN